MNPHPTLAELCNLVNGFDEDRPDPLNMRRAKIIANTLQKEAENTK